jgi:uncharacterized protein (TIGR02646 family)
MISLNRGAQPQILTDHGTQWTQALLNAVADHGGYSNIPSKSQISLIKHYKHDDIKEVLFATSSGKCAFCECIPSEGGNIEVEHFKPKSIYPNYTFSWDNFLPSCRNCNGSKGVHDTVITPIVNPYDIDPSDCFSYDFLLIKAVEGNNEDIANETIQVCSLNSTKLTKPRAELLHALTQAVSSLPVAIEMYEDADTDLKRQNRLRKIQNFLDAVENFALPTEKYSSYSNWFINQSVEIFRAKEFLQLNTVS